MSSSNFWDPVQRLPVSCSNLGDLHPAVARLDGTDAEYVILRGVDQNVLRADIERAGGQLVVVAGRIGGKVGITVVAYQVGMQNSKDWLRQLAKHALADFDLTGEISREINPWRGNTAGTRYRRSRPVRTGASPS